MMVLFVFEQQLESMIDKEKITEVLSSLENFQDGWITVNGNEYKLLNDWFDFICNNYDKVLPLSYKFEFSTQDGSKYKGVWPCEKNGSRFRLIWDIAKYPETLDLDLSRLDVEVWLEIFSRILPKLPIRGNGTHVVDPSDIKRIRTGVWYKPWTLGTEYEINDPILKNHLGSRFYPRY